MEVADHTVVVVAAGSLGSESWGLHLASCIGTSYSLLAMERGQLAAMREHPAGVERRLQALGLYLRVCMIELPGPSVMVGYKLAVARSDSEQYSAGAVLRRMRVSNRSPFGPRRIPSSAVLDLVGSMSRQESEKGVEEHLHCTAVAHLVPDDSPAAVPARSLPAALVDHSPYFVADSEMLVALAVLAVPNPATVVSVPVSSPGSRAVSVAEEAVDLAAGSDYMRPALHHRFPGCTLQLPVVAAAVPNCPAATDSIVVGPVRYFAEAEGPIVNS